MNNKEVDQYLKNNGWEDDIRSEIIDDLIRGGYINEEPESEPERLAKQARKWLHSISSSERVFDFASGWDTASWEVVTGEKFAVPSRIKQIFWTLVLLAKEENIPL